MRQTEQRGRLELAIAVVKMRDSVFDTDVRRYSIEHDGLRIGEPLRNLDGSLARCTVLLPRLGEAPQTLSPELAPRDKREDLSHAEAAAGADFGACDCSVRL